MRRSLKGQMKILFVGGPWHGSHHRVEVPKPYDVATRIEFPLYEETSGNPWLDIAYEIGTYRFETIRAETNEETWVSGFKRCVYVWHRLPCAEALKHFCHRTGVFYPEQKNVPPKHQTHQSE